MIVLESVVGAAETAKVVVVAQAVAVAAAQARLEAPRALFKALETSKLHTSAKYSLILATTAARNDTLNRPASSVINFLISPPTR